MSCVECDTPCNHACPVLYCEARLCGKTCHKKHNETHHNTLWVTCYEVTTSPSISLVPCGDPYVSSVEKKKTLDPWTHVEASRDMVTVLSTAIKDKTPRFYFIPDHKRKGGVYGFGVISSLADMRAVLAVLHTPPTKVISPVREYLCAPNIFVSTSVLIARAVNHDHTQRQYIHPTRVINHFIVSAVNQQNNLHVSAVIDIHSCERCKRERSKHERSKRETTQKHVAMQIAPAA